MVVATLLVWPMFTTLAYAQCPTDVVDNMVVRALGPSFGSISEIAIDLRQAVKMSDPTVNEVIPPTLIVLTRRPSGQTAKGGDVVIRALASRDDPKRIEIQLNPAMTWAPQKDEELEISLGPILLECGPAMIVATRAVIDSPAKLGGQLRLSREELEKATEYVTPVDQKNFYVMMAAVKTAGGDGDGAGAADISIDQTFYKAGRQVGALFDNAAIKFMTKKSSGANADPRTQLIGIEFTKALLWGAANRARLGHELDAETRRNLRQGRGWTRGAVVYETLNLEGDAYDFNAVNFVSDTQFTVPSIAKRLTSRGFWNFRLLAGAELGRSQRQAEEGTAATVTSTTSSDYILRSKIGADIALRWGRAEGDPSRFAIELDAGHVTRFLHRGESALVDVVQDGQTVQQRVSIESGQRHWTQTNLKVYLFGTDTARYGVQLTYYRGSLPPLFAHADAFQFGMVIDVGPTSSSVGR